MSLCPPESGTSYDVTVGPGEFRIVAIRKDSQYNSSYSMENLRRTVIRPDSLLVKEGLEKGSTWESGTEGIYRKIHGHSAGLMYIYKNETTDKQLDEVMGFKIVRGLTIDG